jgi:hypothetical protein
MRRLLMCLILSVVALPALAQRAPEVDALLDALFAKNVSQAMKHLPPSTQKMIAEMSDSDRQNIEQFVPISRMLERENITITRLDDGPVLLRVLEPDANERKFELVLDRRISDGYEALLRLTLQSGQETMYSEGTALVWMRYIEGDWRVFELESSNNHSCINLEDPNLFQGLTNRVSKGSETSAVGSLRIYYTVLASYHSSYPDAGFPSSLDVLGHSDTDDPSANHAGFVDSMLSDPPYEKSGYRFNYQLIDVNQGEYTITARPLEFGRTGTRNFFIDQTGVIRATTEDREATKYDNPI